MTRLEEYLTEEQEYELLFEMANIRPKTTNLSMIVYVSVGKIENKKMRHGPRIKVSKSYNDRFNPLDTFSVTIDKRHPDVIGSTGDINSKDMEQVRRWIVLNYDVLMSYWDDEYDTADLFNNLIKV